MFIYIIYNKQYNHLTKVNHNIYKVLIDMFNFDMIDN